ncbi:MAG: histidinol dehydrogenase [Planctomycetes bacterium]|nr:histidinol dehydrogenase [Planctomycetota bacterium]
MLTEITPSDAAFRELVGATHQRFQRLVAEAEAKARPFYARVLGREASISEVIGEVFDAVARDGDAAVVDYTRKFDGISLPVDSLRIPDDDLVDAWNHCGRALRGAITFAIRQVETYQRRLLPRSFGTNLDEPLGVRWTPLQRVGGYIPGGPKGTLPLFSTVIMNLVPARVAGVEQLVLVTPPRSDGSVAPELLAAAHAVGVTEAYRVGGIPAIAALACGTTSLPKVDKIVGPGNLYVTLAKRHAYGRVDIDMLAGPSEVLVIADDSANPAFVAADLLSQAEHDVLAMSVCLAVGPGIASAVQRALSDQLDSLPDERQAVARESIARFGRLVRCQDVDEAAQIANRIAPEHLEVMVRNPRALLPKLRNAGAIFVGDWSPEPIGDYVAGPSHTLPTGGTARMWSGIGADTFLRRTSIINFAETDFRHCADAGIAMARGEGMEAHARAIEIRLKSS